MANIKHKMYGTPTYRSWSEMKYRCNHNIKRYKDIDYCEEWESFENFYRDMGKRMDNTSLDRINNNNGYSKENCRWATRETQNNNRISTVLIPYNGESLSLSQLARKYKISRSNLANKIYILKWDINKSIKYLIDRRDSYGTKTHVR